MQAECPNCHTIFRVTEAQLDIADGRVRCGFCKQVFDARADKHIQPDAAEDLQLDDTKQPGVFQQTEAEHDALLSGGPGDSATDAPGTVVHAPSYSTLATVSWSLAILTLIAAFAAEYIWFNQPALLQGQRLQPIKTALCKLTDCEHLQIRDPSQIEMISRNIYTHPNENNALMVTTTLVNHAPYAQPYPDVQIDFSNVRGELIASRRFIPEEYLQNDSTQPSLLESGNPVTFGLEIEDPGHEAITYEFSFH